MRPVNNGERRQKKGRNGISKKSVVYEQVEYLKKHCLRKIQTYLRNNIDNIASIRSHSLEIMRRILVLADDNHIKLKSLFVTLVKTMKCSQELSCE